MTGTETHSCLTDSERCVASTVACSPKSAIFTVYAEQLPACWSITGIAYVAKSQTTINTSKHSLTAAKRARNRSLEGLESRRNTETLVSVNTDIGAPGTCEQDVVQLEVAVDDEGLRRVQVRQPCRDLQRPPHGVRVGVDDLRPGRVSVRNGLLQEAGRALPARLFGADSPLNAAAL